MMTIMHSALHMIGGVLGIARHVLYWCAIYWGVCLLRAIGPTLWQSFGATFDDVMADLHRRAMADAPRLQRRGMLLMSLLSRASYAGRIEVYARLVAKMWRRGAVLGAVEGAVCVVVYAILGPFAAPVIGVLEAPPMMLAGLFSAYCAARYVERRTWRGAVAYTLVATWPVACRRAALWFPTMARLRERRRIWRSARPTWAQARCEEDHAQREDYARRLAEMEDTAELAPAPSILPSVNLSALKSFPFDSDPHSLN